MDNNQEELLESRKNFLNEFEKEFSFPHRGRMKRLDFFLLILGLSAVDRFAEHMEGYLNFPYLAWLFFIMTLYLRICIVPKRLRDIGLSGWYALPLMIISGIIAGFMMMALEDPSLGVGTTYIFTAAGLIVLINLPLFIWPSQKRDNKYGVYHQWSLMGGYKPKQ